MNKRLITLWCLLFAFAVASVRAQVIRLTVADFKGKAEYVARDGHKHPLKKGVQLTDESLLYIPYNGEVTLVDETENKYTLKSLGWSSIEDKMKDIQITISKNDNIVNFKFKINAEVKDELYSYFVND